MGKFTKSKNAPAFLKQPNYYSKQEKFNEDIEESSDCTTCGKTPAQIEETDNNMVKTFESFVFEKKKKALDLTGDNKVDSEDWKMARNLAIKKSKAKASGKKINAEEDKEEMTDMPMLNKGKAAMQKKKVKKINENFYEPEMTEEPGDFGGHREQEYSLRKSSGIKQKIKNWASSLPSRLGMEDEPDMPFADLDPEGHYIGEGHACYEGKSCSMVSEAAHHLMESVCESVYEDAMQYMNEGGGFEAYLNECGRWMENRLYEMVDDGVSGKMHESWASESACYESTKEALNEVCESICHEGLRIHNDPTPREYHQYVEEALGCYSNGMNERYKMHESAMYETASDSDEDVIEPENMEQVDQVQIAKDWLLDPDNQTYLMELGTEKIARMIGVSSTVVDAATREIQMDLEKEMADKERLEREEETNEPIFTRKRAADYFKKD